MRKSILALLLAVAPLQAAFAQYGAFDMGALTNTLSQDHVTRSERSRSRSSSSAPSAPAVSQLSRSLAKTFNSSPANVDVSARYTPSNAVRKRLAEIMAEGAGRAGAAEAREMRQLVLSKQALGEYERIAPALGYRANDAVDALAFYLLAQWGVANDYRRDISRTQAAAVRRQAANAYATVANQLESDSRRQEFAEMLAVQGVIMAGAHEAAVRSGDQVALARYAQLARKGGKVLFTMDPTQIALTNAGFRRKN